MRTSGKSNDLTMVLVPGTILALIAWYFFGSNNLLRQLDNTIEHGVMAVVNGIRSLF
jgi:hypothetical protein